MISVGGTIGIQDNKHDNKPESGLECELVSLNRIASWPARADEQTLTRHKCG